MKKILHVCVFERYVEGASYQENLLATRHKELGFDVYIVTSQTSSDNKKRPCLNAIGHYVNDKGIDVTILPNSKHNVHVARFFDHCVGLYDRMVEIAPDIIFVHNFTSKDVRHIVRYAKEYPNVRVYTDCHSDYYNNPIKTIGQKIRHFERGRWGRSLCEISQRMWGTTPWRVEYLQDIYKIPAEKTGLLIMGADEKYIVGKDKDEVRKNVRKQYGIPNNAFLVVTGGTLDKRKQQNLLFDAVKQLKEENVWLLAFGTPTKEMETIFASYKIIPNIVMTGWLAAEKAYDLFMASDLAFFPGTHSVLWEQAVACSTPLVVRHWNGMEHVNVNGNAVLMDEVTIDTIIRQIRALNKTPEYEAMSRHSTEVASQFYLTEIAKKAIGLL